MQVSAVLVDELVLDPSTSSPIARPVLYRFASPRLVSARRVETKARVGPVGVLQEGQTPDVESYPERPLSWEGRRRNAFSYKEPWTAPAWTLYVLLPPAEFFASSLEFRGPRDSTSQRLTPASSEDRLFYFSLLGHAPDQHGFQIEARFEHDPSGAARRLAEVETVAGRRKWTGLRDSVAGPLRASGAIIASAAAIRALFGL
jgi:hypothetical protein